MNSALGLSFSSALHNKLKPWRPIYTHSLSLSSAREALLELPLSPRSWTLVITGGFGCLAWPLLDTATQVRGLLWGPIYLCPAPSSPWGSQQPPSDWAPASPPDTHLLCPLRLPRASRVNLGKLNQSLLASASPSPPTDLCAIPSPGEASKTSPHTSLSTLPLLHLTRLAALLFLSHPSKVPSLWFP